MYECYSCHKTFHTPNIEKIPERFFVFGCGTEIPKCPECGTIFFLGMETCANGCLKNESV